MKLSESDRRLWLTVDEYGLVHCACCKTCYETEAHNDIHVTDHKGVGAGLARCPVGILNGWYDRRAALKEAQHD